jgi:cytochrome c-type biogenesis protein CcmH
MTGFIVAVLLAIAATLLLLLRPLIWRGREAAATASHRQLNAAIYRDQFVELERDRAEGTLGEEDYQQARAELQRRVLEDGQEDAAVTAPQAPKKTLFILAVALPLAAAGLYALLGNPEGLNPPAPQHRFTPQEIEGMVAGLAAKLEKEPENVKGWAMLARSYRAMGRLPEAERAFGRAEKFIEQDAQLLADYADVAAANAGGNFAGKPAQLIEKALKVDPDNAQALWLAGSAAFAGNDFARALVHWERLLTQLQPGSEDHQAVQQNIEQMREALSSSKGKGGQKPE